MSHHLAVHVAAPAAQCSSAGNNPHRSYAGAPGRRVAPALEANRNRTSSSVVGRGSGDKAGNLVRG